eukprot:TRINITY_DN24593_c0_g1_i1.p1 TRINITY_DN24593_c0_g1~~TRINITY_DN24593_c0_g1_i1.p1  ORF type:complete len:439 (+),score=37.54 TRINITY_DN24593_c0_g1_i1:77-1318(+)
MASETEPFIDEPDEGPGLTARWFLDHSCALLFVGALFSAAHWVHEEYKATDVEVDYFYQLSLLLFAALVVGYDWYEYGITVAIKHGALGLAVSWLLMVPLRFVGGVALHVAIQVAFWCGFTTLFIGMAAAGITDMTCKVFCMASVLYVSLSCVFMWYDLTGILTVELGRQCVFVATYACVRKALQVMWDRYISAWPYVSEVSQDTDEFREQADFFAASCKTWEHKYDFGLRPYRLYRVDRPGEDARKQKISASGRRLFHGTSFDAARSIVSTGFRLPRAGGMFGKGIYFADCPNKSWQYCFFWGPCMYPLHKYLPRVFHTPGIMFVCWVDLGKQKRKRWATGESAEGYKKTWWSYLVFGTDEYDSVVGLSKEEGGTLRVPEYVVYKPEQVRICYLWEVLPDSKAQPGAGGASP